MEEYIERITQNNKVLAIIIRAKAIKKNKDKMKFVSPEDFPFQLGVHNRNKNDYVEPHQHLPFQELKNLAVQELFYMISGKIKVDLYDENDLKIKEVIISKGDTILLNTGHGVTFLKKSKLIEIKQGPYRGREQEKRF